MRRTLGFILLSLGAGELMYHFGIVSGVGGPAASMALGLIFIFLSTYEERDSSTANRPASGP